MPNWVFNNLQASGSIADIQAFIEKAGKPHTTEFTGKRYQDKNGVWQYDADAIVVEENTDPFSFWNFVRPEESILPVYFGHEKVAKPEGYEDWTMDEKLTHDLKFTGNNSYDWNVRNWGTKWDACDVSADEPTIDEKAGLASVSFSFNTAWGIPEPVFQAIVQQHPELDFNFESEEEQGWGAEYTSSDGDDLDEDGKPMKSLIMTREWDIPDSHADYVERGNEDGCSCSYSDDEDDWYDDCPRVEKEFTVVVQQTYTVKATNAEAAWELADEKLGGVVLDLGENIEATDDGFMFVRDTNSGERLYPTLGGGE